MTFTLPQPPETPNIRQIAAWINTNGASSGGASSWASITGKPTTLSGYGITDAYTMAASDARYAVPATSLAGYGITDAYTKTAADARYLQLAGSQTVTGRPVLLGGFDADANPTFASSGDSKPAGVVAASTAALHLHRSGSFGYSYNEDAELRVAHGGPSTTGSNVELWVNGSGNTSGVPDVKVATFGYDGNLVCPDFVLA